MPGFSSFRILPFEPWFHWEPDLAACADRINRPHRDDYPAYVYPTEQALAKRIQNPWPASNGPWPDAAALQALHQDIFHNDKPSQWRQGNVLVGLHKAPDWQVVTKLMAELHFIYQELPVTLANIQEWYTDFQTIHPFLDGNGRVGGCAVVLLVHWNLDCSQEGLFTPGA